MKRKKIAIDDYNLFFQEMILAERNYHKNDDVFNEHVNNILNMKNPDYIYRIFINFLDYDYDKLLQALSNCEYSENYKDSFSFYIYYFAVQRKIPAEKFIMPLYNYYMHFSNLKNEFSDSTCSSTDKHFLPLYYFCCEFINEFDDKNIDLLTDIFIRIQEYEFNDFIRSSNYYLLIENINKFNISRIAVDLFSRYYNQSEKEDENVSIDKIADSLILCKNYSIICEFAKYIPGAPIEKLGSVVASGGEAKNIYKFAKDIPDAPIEELADAMMRTSDYDLLIKFFKMSCADNNKLADVLLKYGKKLDKKNIRINCVEDEKYQFIVKQFLKYHQDLHFDKVLSLLFQLSSNDVLNYICTSCPYRIDNMFSEIVESDYATYFKFYLLKDLTIDYYRFFLNTLKDMKNISFLETFTSVDSIIQNSVDNSKNDIFNEMQVLQDKVINSINIADISDVSKCTLKMILHKINEFNINYMIENDDDFSFKVFQKKIRD